MFTGHLHERAECQNPTDDNFDESDRFGFDFKEFEMKFVWKGEPKRRETVRAEAERWTDETIPESLA